VKLILTVLFWFGVIGAVREWRYAKKAGAPIARTEKWYLAGGLMLAVAVSLIGDFAAIVDLFQTRTSVVFWIVLVLIGWTARQMSRRIRGTGASGRKANGPSAVHAADESV
jgi:hypothetical protein